MKKSEIFARVLAAVSEITEILPEDILSKSHREDITDARMLLVYFCHAEGLYAIQIANFVGLSTRQVNRLISAWNANALSCNRASTQRDIYAHALASKLGH